MDDSKTHDVVEHRCILTDVKLTPANNSKAHVIPSALGGRLKPWNILSRTANSMLGDTVDKLLIDALAPLMTQLGASRDRGENQPVEMEDSAGQRYSVGFNEPARLAKHNYREITRDGQTEIQIEGRTHREVKTLLGRVKARAPGLELDDAMKHAKVSHRWPAGGKLKLQLEIGPRRTFPGCFVAASIFAAAKGLPPHPEFRSYVEKFDVDEPVSPPSTFYFYSDRPWAMAPGEITHKVVLLASSERQKALVFLELFNVLELGILLPYDGQVDKTESYGVDLLVGAEVPVQVDEAVVRSFPWTASHSIDDPSLQKIITARIARLTQIAQERATEAFIGDELAEAQKRLEGPITAATMLHALEVAANTTMQELTRPGTPSERTAEILRRFEAMLSDLGQLLPSAEQNAFTTGAQELVQRVASARPDSE